MAIDVLPGARRSPLAHGQLALLALLALLTAAAWGYTIHQARSMDMPMGVVARGGADAETGEAAAPSENMDGMHGMDGMAMDEPAAQGVGEIAAAGMTGMADGWTWAGFTTFLVAWAVMMAAMMFPAAAPMLLLFRRVSIQQRTNGIGFVPTWVFATGYLLVWTAIGVQTWLLVRLANDVAGRLADAERATWAPLALGATLVAAGLYQLTPLKRVCLDQCRTPLDFVMTHWREGAGGALRMGVMHGAYCLGCCWALFAVLVAAGVMSLAWMLLLTLVIFAEKVLPLGRRAPQAVGAALLLLGVLVATGATEMPWRT